MKMRPGKIRSKKLKAKKNIEWDEGGGKQVLGKLNPTNRKMKLRPKDNKIGKLNLANNGQNTG
jgi:hypothetical protein